MANKKKNFEINNPKVQMKISKVTLVQLKHLYISQSLNQRESNSNNSSSTINQMKFKNWYMNITLKIQDTFQIKKTTRLDSGADQNCIKELLIPSQYYQGTKEQPPSINRNPLECKLSKAFI